MPIREYICLGCDAVFENLELKPEDAPSECPYCKHKHHARKVTTYGGYNGDLGSATTKSKNHGSFRK